MTGNMASTLAENLVDSSKVEEDGFPLFVEQIFQRRSDGVERRHRRFFRRSFRSDGKDRGRRRRRTTRLEPAGAVALPTPSQCRAAIR